MSHGASNDYFFKIKGSEYRKLIAKCLIYWKKNKSLRKISRLLNLHRHTITIALGYSRFFQKNTYNSKTLLSKQLITKNSPYRKEIAKCLNAWRKNRLLKKTAITLGYTKEKLTALLKQSRFYRERINLSQTDRAYVQKWSNKIKATNILGGQCSKCGIKDIFVLDFHHVKDDKEKEVGKLLNKNWKTISNEIDKCILLCRNCHQEMHHQNMLRADAKKYLMSIIGNPKCSCGYDKVEGLVFHHVDDTNKLFAVSSAMRMKKNKLIAEVKKCEVLCGNCHALKHIKHKKFKKLKFLILNKVKQIYLP